ALERRKRYEFGRFLRPYGAFGFAHRNPRACARGYYLAPLPGLRRRLKPPLRRFAERTLIRAGRRRRFAERTLPGEMRGGGSFGVSSDGVEPFVGGDEEGAVGGDGGGVDGAVEVDFVNHFFFLRGREDGQV